MLLLRFLLSLFKLFIPHHLQREEHLDEWLNYKVTEKDAKFLYELFEQRSGNNPTIFVGQYPVDEWHERLGGGTQADSIMDRIIHNAYEIPTSETNLRKIYDTKKLKRLIDEIES